MVSQWYDFAAEMGLLNYAKVMTSQDLNFYSKLVYAKSRVERRKQEKVKKKELLGKADIIISTPRLLSKDLNEKVFDKHLIDHVEMLFIDEASEIMTPNPCDPIWTYDTKAAYAPILENFKHKQTVGLTATPGDPYELRVLEEKLNAKTIGPSDKDIARYAFRVETQKYYIIDPWVQRFDNGIKKIIASNLDVIRSILGINWREMHSRHLLRIVTSQINNSDERVSSAAKSVIKAIYTRLILYERSFRALFDYVNRIESRGEQWDYLRQLIAERAQEEPYSSKTRQFVKLIKLSR
jgi:ERCC4-related helicase